MSIFETIIGASITGIGSGAGAAIGTYFAQKAFIKHFDKLEKRFVKMNKKIKQRKRKTVSGEAN